MVWHLGRIVLKWLWKESSNVPVARKKIPCYEIFKFCTSYGIMWDGKDLR